MIFFGALRIVDKDIINDSDNVQTQNFVPDETQNITSVQKKNNLISSEKTLDVQFIPQAPFHDWEEPWQNSCEEAAIFNSYYYLEGLQNISKEQIRDDIQAMIDWQVGYFGKHKDLNIEEIAVVIKKYLGYEYKIIEIISIDDIKKEISDGNPVVIPAAGRILENEHFTQPAPVYHMLTVIGYTKDKIITNDPGTQFGEKMEYSYENIMESIHDWVEGAKEDPDLMMNGKKVGIVVVDSK